MRSSRWAPAARTAARVDQHAQPGSVDELKRGHLNTHARVGIAKRAQLALDGRAGRKIEAADQRQRPDAIGVVGQHRGQPAIHDRLTLRRYGAAELSRATAPSLKAPPPV